MNKVVSCLLFIFLFLNLFCGNEEIETTKKTVKDDNGNLFVLDNLPRKIVSLAPNLTEILYAIGADSLLVGVTNYCDYPPQAKNKTKVGGILDPDYEVISYLNPDIILLTTEGNPKNVYYSLKNYNFKVFVSNPQDIYGVAKTISNLGKLTGKEEKSGILSNMLLDKKSEFELLNKGITRKKCLLLISVSPFITINRFTFLNEIIELSGLDNIYKDEINSYPMINSESITKQNPDFILVSLDTNNSRLKYDYMNTLTDELSTTGAVIDKKIIFLDENILLRPGPRVIDCIETIRNIISK